MLCLVEPLGDPVPLDEAAPLAYAAFNKAFDYLMSSGW